MGLRATSITKYEIEYGGVQGFNYDSNTLAEIIGHYCDDFYCGQDCCPDTDVIWEIDKKQFADMVASLEGMSETDFSDLMDFIGEGDYTREYVVKILKGFLADTQEDSNYVRIGWV